VKGFFLFVGMLFYFLEASAKVVEVSSFKELPQFLEKERLVIFDIDNTLYSPEQFLGSDPWFDHRVKEYQASMSTEEAFEKTFAEWMAIECLTKVKLVEEEAPKIIKKLQQEGYALMALTLRAVDLSFCTMRQLHSLDLDLSITAPSHGDFFFLNAKPHLFRKGVLYTDGNDLGKGLLKFFQKIHYFPKSILYINDKEAQLKEVEAMCKKVSIPFVGLRYGGFDSRAKEFDPSIASVQLAPLSQILSDQEAKEKLFQKR
jgi:hypothetical protein